MTAIASLSKPMCLSSNEIFFAESLTEGHIHSTILRMVYRSVLTLDMGLLAYHELDSTLVLKESE